MEFKIMHNFTAYKALKRHHHKLSQRSLAQLFAEDSRRFKRFSLEAASLLVDYSKNHLIEKTLEQLIAFAHQQDLSAQIFDLFSGKQVNNTEKRSALHTALRDPSHQSLFINEVDITALIHQTLATMTDWVTQLQQNKWLGYAQKPIQAIVHIGIGGSYLGPLMVSEALAPYANNALACHFVASVDFAELDAVLAKLNPETTLFILASKTFTTEETRLLAERAKHWLLQSAGSKDISSHFIAITAHLKNAQDYGIAAEHILPFWEWVGGRYSIWSAMGLPIALQIGMTGFKQLLAGAHAMDQHFRTAPFNANLPVILGLIDFWYTEFFNVSAQAILPYDYRLRSFPRYLQQLEMESNGKCVQKDGRPIEGLTAPVLFGEIGTNGQHSFHQLLFQGTHLIPCDFIGVINANSPQKDRGVLLAHCLAQSRGRMLGKSGSDIQHELMQQGYELDLATQLAMHQAIPGNQPSNTLLIPKLNPYSLGALIALYEHRTFVQGVLWNINSFDQWGVELGKKIAKELLPYLSGQKEKGGYDSSTTGLLEYIQTSSSP